MRKTKEALESMLNAVNMSVFIVFFFLSISGALAGEALAAEHHG